MSNDNDSLDEIIEEKTDDVQKKDVIKEEKPKSQPKPQT